MVLVEGAPLSVITGILTSTVRTVPELHLMRRRRSGTKNIFLLPMYRALL